MFAPMSSWQTALVSLAGLLIGAGLAVAGSHFKDPTLLNLGSTIVGGALGMFVPQIQAGARAHLTKRPTHAPPPLPPRS